MAIEARNHAHASDVLSRCLPMTYNAWGCYILDLEGLDVDVADLYGPSGRFLTEYAQEYNYDMHPSMQFTGNDMAFSFPGWATGLLLHW